MTSARTQSFAKTLKCEIRRPSANPGPLARGASIVVAARLASAAAPDGFACAEVS
jgi:hypothetical protein